MKLRYPLAAAMLALFAIATPVDDPNAVKAAIQKEMNKYVAAMKKKDFSAVDAVIKANFAPEFKETDMNGVARNRAQTLAILRQQTAMFKSVDSMTYKINTFKIVGKKGMSTDRMVLNATIASGAGQTSKLMVDSEWTSTFEKRGTKWLCIASKNTKQKVLMDGKPIG